MRIGVRNNSSRSTRGLCVKNYYDVILRIYIEVSVSQFKIQVLYKPAFRTSFIMKRQFGFT
jgi:hypothetical protein